MQGVSINLPDNILNHPEFLTKGEKAKFIHLRIFLLLVFAVPLSVGKKCAILRHLVKSEIILGSSHRNSLSPSFVDTTSTEK